MSRRKFFQYRLICLLITLFMVVMGVRVGENHADSLLTCSAFGNASYQKLSMEKEPVVYRDNSILSQLENFTVLRNTTRVAVGTRLALWLTVFVLPSTLLMRILTWQKSVILRRVCKNQYRHRTLEYIHQMDGKKA